MILKGCAVYFILFFIFVLLCLEIGNHLLCKLSTTLVLCICQYVLGEGGRMVLSGHIQVTSTKVMVTFFFHTDI